MRVAAIRGRRTDIPMPRVSDRTLKAELEKRGFTAVSVKRKANRRVEVDANKLHAVPLAGEEPVYVELPVSLSVGTDKQGRVQSVEGGTPDDAAVADAMHYLKTLRDTGQLAEPTSAGGALPSGATHQIERDEQGRRVLKRMRFSIAQGSGIA